MKRTFRLAMLPLLAAFAMTACDKPENEGGQLPEVSKTTYYSTAQASYEGAGDSGAATFVVDFSGGVTRADVVSAPDLHLTLHSAAPADTDNLSIPVGTYTAASSAAAGTFSLGSETEIAGTCFHIGSTIIPVTGGSITVSHDADYLVKGTLKLSDGTEVTVQYEGTVDVANNAPATVISREYASAVGSYYGTSKLLNVADFQIKLSTRGIVETTPPVSYLYLSVTCNPVEDIENLKVETGEYTLGSLDAQTPGKFYAGMAVDGGYTGSIAVDQFEFLESEVYAVVDGSFTISAEGSTYTIGGTLALEDGTLLEISYKGALVVDNYSDEGTPADELEIGESHLTGDVAIENSKVVEAYCGYYNPLFADREDFEYVFFWLYTSDFYDEYFQVGLLIDRTKYPDELLPAGKYPVMNRLNSEFASMPLSSLGACSYVAAYNLPAYYGCWYMAEYDTVTSPLVSGEVEVVESKLERAGGSGLKGTVSLKFNLQDNAATPHTVSGSFSGKVDNL